MNGHPAESPKAAGVNLATHLPVDLRVVPSLSEPQFAIVQRSPWSPAQNWDSMNICFTHHILYSYFNPPKPYFSCSAHMENNGDMVMVSFKCQFATI